MPQSTSRGIHTGDATGILRPVTDAGNGFAVIRFGVHVGRIGVVSYACLVDETPRQACATYALYIIQRGHCDRYVCNTWQRGIEPGLVALTIDGISFHELHVRPVDAPSMTIALPGRLPSQEFYILDSKLCGVEFVDGSMTVDGPTIPVSEDSILGLLDCLNRPAGATDSSGFHTVVTAHLDDIAAQDNASIGDCRGVPAWWLALIRHIVSQCDGQRGGCCVDGPDMAGLVHNPLSGLAVYIRQQLHGQQV